MTSAGGSAWRLVQRADADAPDRDRAAVLCADLGERADLVTTEEADELDEVLADLDGRVLVVCGGDGSLHLAVNRLLVAGLADDVVVALLPCGTGNDLAHTLATPDDPGEVAGLLRSGATRRLDVLALEVDGADRGVAVNAVHAGIGVEAAERAQDLKDRLGDLAYPVGSLAAGMGVEGLDVEVRVDDRAVPGEGPLLMVGVGNGRTIGGGRPLFPDAAPDDGRLDVVVSRALGPSALAAYGVAMLRGTHVDRDDVELVRGRVVEVVGPVPALDVDGELWDDPASHVRAEVRPGAVTFVGA